MGGQMQTEQDDYGFSYPVDDPDDGLDPDVAREFEEEQQRAQEARDLIEEVQSEPETVMAFFNRRSQELLDESGMPDFSVFEDVDPATIEKAKVSWRKKRQQQVTRETNEYAKTVDDSLDDRVNPEQPYPETQPWGREAIHREKLAKTRLQLQQAVAAGEALTKEDQAQIILAPDDQREVLSTRITEARKMAAANSPEVKHLRNRLSYLEAAAPYARLDDIEMARLMVEKEDAYRLARAAVVKPEERPYQPHRAVVADADYEVALKDWQDVMRARGARAREAGISEARAVMEAGQAARRATFAALNKEVRDGLEAGRSRREGGRQLDTEGASTG
jgi:hypothetical protein